MKRKGSESQSAILASISSDVLIAAMKFVASSFTGSSAMFSEGIHSVVDAVNGLLLLYGIRSSRRPPDNNHQFGHGRELYFWTLIVALSIFAIGGGVSIYDGIRRIQEPQTLVDPFWNYVVLGVSFLLESISWIFGWVAFRKERGHRSIIETIRSSKDPSNFSVILEDSTAMLGLSIAFAGIFLGARLEVHFLDGLAAVLIGLLLATVALLLGYRAKNLVIGEAVETEVFDGIRVIAESEPAVSEMITASTIYIGPHNISVTLELRFHDSVTVAELRVATRRIEKRIREQYPDVTHVSFRNDSRRN